MALPAAPFVQAQNSDAVASRPQMEEVMVSARKVAESVQTVPISMTALSSSMIENQSIANISDVQGQIPNLFLQTHPSEPQSLSLAMRGQKQNDIAITLDPSVGIYVDNLYYPRTIGLRGALVDVERIEVLRGPQGTLYGRNTTGGAMSIFSKDPTDILGGSLHLSAGNYNQREAVGVINVPLADKVALRVVAQRGAHDGYGSDGLGRDLADESSSYLRAKLKAELSPTVTATLSGSYQHTDAGAAVIQLAGLSPNGALLPTGSPGPEGGFSTVQTATQAGLSVPQAVSKLNSYIGGVGGDIYKTAGTTPGWSNFTGRTFGFDLTAELAHDLKLRSITGYEALKRENNGDFDGTPYVIVAALRTTDTSYTSQEFQLLGGNEKLNWVAGLYVGVERGDDGTVGDAIPQVNPRSPTTFNAEVDQKTYAVFSQANWEFIQDWRLTAGLRYSWDDRELTVNNYNRLQPCLVPAQGVSTVGGTGTTECPRTFNDNFSDPSWLLSLDHKLSDAVMGYAKVARGYRTGGRNTRGSSTIESFAVFDPETVTEYEAGVKSELFDRQLRLNLAVYHDQYKNIQRSVGVPTAGGAPTTIVTNAGKGHVDGFEADAQWYIGDRVTLSSGVGLTDAKYDDFVDITGDRSHETFGVPKWTASASARYVQPVTWGEIAAQIDYRWQDDVELVPDAPSVDQVTQSAYGLLNGRLSFNVNQLDMEIAVFGKNVLDKEYYASGASSERSLGYNYLIVGEPRTFGVEFSKKFGGI
jgi:iron complex outermembrane receptor protein